MATSRSALNVSGEHQFPVAPLLLPDPQGHLSVETLANNPSVALYVSRAQAADPYFTLTEANAHAVAEICSRLDGLPLAIELAAAHTRLLKPHELLTRLNHRFSLLRGGPTDLPPRQRTLRAAIRWSCALLDDWEQIIFSRLAVFLGGWTLEAAEAIGRPLEALAVFPDSFKDQSSYERILRLRRTCYEGGFKRKQKRTRKEDPQ